MCIFMAESHCCMTETNTTLQSNYPPIKKTKLSNKQCSKTVTRQKKLKEIRKGFMGEMDSGCF